MMLEPSMKRFLACVATAIALCLPGDFVRAEEDDSSGRVRLTQGTAPPPPVPHVVGSDDDSGRAVAGRGGPDAQLPSAPMGYDDYIGAGRGGVGYQLGDPFTVQYRLNRAFGGLYGYDNGFTDIGAFVPTVIDTNSILFYDLRGFVTDNRDGGFNFGVGRRWYDDYADRVWSHSLWLDYDGGHINQYLRAGYSGSMVSRYWRYRWNGYYVVSDQHDFVSASYADAPVYQGTNMALDRMRLREVAFSGFDFTVGGPMPLLGQFGLNWATGLYYNAAQHGKDSFGFIAQADAQLTEDMMLMVNYTNDPTFGTNAQMNLSINLPDGRPSRILRQARVHDYMLRSDVRNYRVPTRRYRVDDRVLVLNECENPYNVAHIIPDAEDDAAPTGDGSAENPFNSLAAWENLTNAEKSLFDIILVRPGEDVPLPPGANQDNLPVPTYQANLNTGITIGENQRLLASTGRLVRTIEGGEDVFRYAAHQFNANVPGLGNGITYNLPGTDSLAGTIFDPLVDDPRPMLANHAQAALPDAPHAVVTISNLFSGACEVPTEVSGFQINGYNPNLPLEYNIGIASGNYADDLADRAITSFDINSNFIRDVVHGINIVSSTTGQGFTNDAGEAVGRIEINQVEGAGFYSNSGIHVEHIEGTLNLSVADNLVYHFYGEDIDNDGILLALPPALFPNGTEDVNGNQKLDIGEDFNNDGMISVNEDNDKDGIIGRDDHGIGINVIANNGSTINANIPDVILADGTIVRGYNISRNTTWVDEAELGRDVNGYINRNNVNTSDMLDIIGNRSGMNLEALGGATFNALVADNDTSFNNPWSDVNAQGNFVPPNKNQDMMAPPAPRLPLSPWAPNPNGDGTPGDPTDPVFSNGFGFRAAATGVDSQMNLNSPNRHISNNNYGNGAVLSAREGGFLNMITPMIGEVIVNDDGLITDVVAANEFNNNGLNGLLITGDGEGSSLAVQIGVPLGNFIQDNALTPNVNEAENVDTLFERVLNRFNNNGQHFVSGTAPNAFEHGNGITISLKNDAAIVENSNGVSSGIYHAQANSNRANGLLIDVGNDVAGALMQNFTIDNSDFSLNGVDGISVSMENLNLYGGPEVDLNNGIGAIHNLRITNNIISAFNTNGINFQMLDSDLTNPFISGNTITSNLISPEVESLFDIELVFGAGFTASQIATIEAAARRWEQIIVGDLPDVVYNGETIDDIRITVDVDAIDGPGSILAVGGTSFANLRDDADRLPFLSFVIFDEADMISMENNNLLFDVAIHEMGHALGFLSQYWQIPEKNLLDFENPTSPIFTGSTATAEYNALFGVNANGVPLQSTGNNMAGGHWDQGTFGNEVMTPFIGTPPMPLSRVTAAAMQDLGYVVNLNAADPYAPGMAPVNGNPSFQSSGGQLLTGPATGNATMVTMPEPIVVIDPSVFDSTNPNSGNGINFSIMNSNLVNAVIDRNEITDVRGDGIRMVNPQFRTNSLTDRFDPITINPPGNLPPFTGADNYMAIQINQITGSGGHGVNLALNLDNQLDAVICGNNISENTLGGINVELANNAIYRNGHVDPGVVNDPTTTQVEGETSFFWGNTINGNGGIGYHITARNDSQFTLVGSLPFASVMDGNTDAGIGIEMFNDTVGDFRMDNITIDNTVDGPSTVFNGDGVGVVLRNNSQLNNFRLGDPVIINPNSPPALTSRQTRVRGNAGDGVNIRLFGTTQLTEGLIANSTISGNGRDGINIVRNQSGVVGDLANVLPAPGAPPATAPEAPDPAFVIRHNNILNNQRDGVNVSAFTANTNDEYLMLLNNVTGNQRNGVTLFTQGNAGLLFDLRQNNISNNGLHGLQQLTDIINPAQTTGYTGTIVGNVFNNNGGDGIQLAGIYGRVNNAAGTGNVTRPVQIGSLFTEDVNNNGFLDPGEDLDGDGRLDRDRNLITNNGGVGINLLGSGTTNIDNNLIDNNGDTGINVTDGNSTNIRHNTISNNDQHGIAMTANTNTIFSIVANIEDNAILDNARDGVQIVATLAPTVTTNNTRAGIEQVVVDMNRNLIADNGGRGIDTTVRGDGAARVSITDVIVSGNQESGIYNLVTASTTQDVEALGSAPLAQDGSIFANAFLDFSINATGAGITQVGGTNGPTVNFGPQNQIINNNVSDTYDGGGLVFRVGTTGAIQNLNQPWANANSVDPTALGGLVASIENTNIANNNGVDFWIHTFVSTVDPATTGGTWTDQNENPRNNANDVFNPTGFQQDPLARIRIEALDNVSGGSADVFGWSRSFNTNSNEEFAYYNNNEVVFKSRGITGVGPDTANDGTNLPAGDDNGPFTTGTRPRNATRLASRTGFTTYNTTLAGTTTAVAGGQLPPGLTIIDGGRNSDNFLYPGLGISTMQIFSGADMGLSGFNNVISNFANEVGFTGGNGMLGTFQRDTNYMWQVFP